MIEGIASKVTSMVKNNLQKELTDEQENVIRYGFDIMIYQLFILTIVLGLSLITGTLGYTLVSFLVYSSLRAFGGGAHASTRILCGLTYLSLLAAVITASVFLEPAGVLLSLILLPVNLSIFLRYAPGDTEDRPIITKKHFVKRKIIAACILIVYHGAAVFIWRYSPVYYNIILFSIIPVTFMITPLGYKILKCRKSNASMT